MLSVEDQATLDTYKGLMDQVRSPVDPDAAPASTTKPTDYGVAPTAAPPRSASSAIPPGFDPSQVEPATRGGHVRDPKQRARWLLQRGSQRRFSSGKFDDAAAKLAEARAFNIKWGLFDDTPDKVEESLRKVSRPRRRRRPRRPRPPASRATSAKRASPPQAGAQVDRRAAMRPGRGDCRGGCVLEAPLHHVGRHSQQGGLGRACPCSRGTKSASCRRGRSRARTFMRSRSRRRVN